MATAPFLLSAIASAAVPQLRLRAKAVMRTPLLRKRQPSAAVSRHPGHGQNSSGKRTVFSSTPLKAPPYSLFHTAHSRSRTAPPMAHRLLMLRTVGRRAGSALGCQLGALATLASPPPLPSLHANACHDLSACSRSTGVGAGQPQLAAHRYSTTTDNCSTGGGSSGSNDVGGGAGAGDKDAAWRVIPGNFGQDHVGLVVTSVSEVSRFLIDVFGCRFDWEVKRDATPTAGERFIDHRLGARSWSDLFGVHHDAAMRHVMMLKAGDAHLAQYIELFEWTSPDQRREWPKFSDVGHAYISFTVADVAAVISHVDALAIPGVRIIQDPPMEFAMRDEVCSSTFVTTPWGLWIELCEWSESKKVARVMASATREGATAAVAAVATSSHSVDAAGAGDNHVTSAGHPDVGRSIVDVATPCWFVDMDVVDANAALMGERMRAAGVKWRPPVKAHRCPQLARELVDRHGAEGVLVLSLDEAALFAEWGFEDIHLANQVSGAASIAQLVEIVRRARGTLRINVDDADNAQEVHDAAVEAAVTVEVLVEVNVNHNRGGVSPGEVPDIVRACVELEAAGAGAGVRYVGLQGYEGHTPILPSDEKTEATAASHGILAEAKALTEAAGLPVPNVCGGGSCNYMDCLTGGVLTEIQAGGGALCDRLYKGPGGLGEHGHEYGTFVLAEITSVQRDGSRAVGNAGFKQVGWHPFGGPAQPADRSDIEVTGLSAEQCRIFPKAPATDVGLRRGDKVVLVPGYSDAMGYGWKKLYATRGGKVEAVWPTGGVL